MFAAFIMVCMTTLCMASNYAETDSLITKTTTPVSVNSQLFPNKPTDPEGGIHAVAAASIVSNPPKENSDVNVTGKVDSTYSHGSLSGRHAFTSEPIPTGQSHGITKLSDTTLLPEMDGRTSSPIVNSTGSVLYSEPKETNSVDMAEQRSNESQAAEANASVAFLNLSDSTTYPHAVFVSSEQNSMSFTIQKHVPGMSIETQETNPNPSLEEQASDRLMTSSSPGEIRANTDEAVSSRQLLEYGFDASMDEALNSGSSGDGAFHASAGNITKLLPALYIKAAASSLSASPDVTNVAPCSTNCDSKKNVMASENVLIGKAISDPKGKDTMKCAACSELITGNGVSTDIPASSQPADTFADASMHITGASFKANIQKAEAVVSGQVKEPANDTNVTSQRTSLYTETLVDSAESFEHLWPEDKGDVTLNTSHNTAVEAAAQTSNISEQNGGHIKPARWTNPSESLTRTDSDGTAISNSSESAPEERYNAPSPPVALRFLRIKLFKLCKRAKCDSTKTLAGRIVFIFVICQIMLQL